MNKLYVKKQLYGLQVEENMDQLEHLNKFNMLNTQLLYFRVKIEEEDKSDTVVGITFLFI
jgi:hypothetical protein